MAQRKTAQAIITAVKCRLAELRRMRPSRFTQVAIRELKQLLYWIRTGKVLVQSKRL